MTTDTKAVARWDWDDLSMITDAEGDFVRFTDHERVVGELTKAHEQNLSSWLDQRQEIDTLRTALAASRAEVEGLKKYRAALVWAIQKTIHESTYETDLIELVAKIDAAMENGNV